ncbi:hypothetical protein CDAR_234122 [Caerostris darwini]|uniref:Uncharacterized protein n=1 Tax=Caerostris darwini TaxID=1538125 RepID=A0AAV4QI96_9ARAC|nr:hypothetical protein CDAR_234122 [Caerostris darwini]
MPTQAIEIGIASTPPPPFWTSIAASRRQTKSESVSPDADIARTEADIRLGETPGVREIGQMSPRVPSPLESYGP